MGYRDETETLRRRVTEVEGELAEARETIDRLTGLSSAAETGVEEERSALIGAPSSLRLVRELELEVSEEGLEAIAALLRERDPNRVVSQVGRSLSAPGFELTQREGLTTVTMAADYRGATLGAVSGAALGGGFGAMASLALVHDLIARLPDAQLLVHALWLAPMLMALLFVGLRARFARVVEQQSAAQRATFEACVELAKRHRVRGSPRVRVAVDDGAPEELEVSAAEAPSRREV